MTFTIQPHQLGIIGIIGMLVFGFATNAGCNAFFTDGRLSQLILTCLAACATLVCAVFAFFG